MVHKIFAEHTLSTLKITDKYVKFQGFLLPTVKIKIADINHLDIRTFKEGNVMYGSIDTVDAYKYVLISKFNLPQKRIDKIHSSRKKKIIKYAVSYKLCKALAEVLPQNLRKPIEYQLFLYKRAR